MQKKLVRPKEGRIIAGVAKGLAEYLGLPVGLVRLIWILLFLPGGAPGLIPYIILWIFIPSEENAK